MTIILSAERCPARFGTPKTSRLNPASANGIRYERRVGKALTVLAISNNLILESQPWFSYELQRSDSHEGQEEIPVQQWTCAPDFILYPFDKSWLLVIDAKQTFYQKAFEKLDQLYLSVVAKAYQKPVNGVLICKILIPGAPKPIDSLREYKPFASAVYHWPEIGPSLVW